MTDALGDDLDAGLPQFDSSDAGARWSRAHTVPRGFGFRRGVALFLLLVTPPVTRRTLAMWAILLGGGGLLLAWFWYVGTQLPDTSAVDLQVRLAADISASVIVGFVIVVPFIRPSGFRGGASERARIVGYTYGVSMRGSWVRVQLVAIRRVRRFVGVVAIQLPDGEFLFVPRAFFLSREDWATVQASFSSN